MKTILIKTRCLYIFTFLILLTRIGTSCIGLSSASENNENTTTTSNRHINKAIKEVILVDKGAFVPSPITRRVVLTLQSSDDILLSYKEQEGNMPTDTEKGGIPITAESRDDMRDEIEKIAEQAEDGLDVKRGKQICVGMNDLDVAVVYNTGDTSRFVITGAVRCDPSLYPSVWALDSMATEVFKTHKNRIR